ncbi:MAG: tRNA 2-thiouridine(34) synthase MnmA [Ignavibacteriales bacterium CG18_big_fil_WC_8_21_14_2_50_31_20]|nr:MAG: tRNA 2-thiouridine(34) synthase MnmA [Ignavibacteriales bacterium CG18_big_fil_WC_8_21_14_2_50_31_20]
MNKNRVIVAMSGGVDSSVAAALLHREGYEVIGITMKTWGFMEVGGAPKHESGCCSLDAIFDAKNVATQFDFPHYTVDFTKSFEKAVINNFVDEYFAGRTPNPCVICNRAIKWEELLEKANQLDAYYVATGHYAKVDFDKENNRYCLINSADSHKDQTYALWGLTQESLSRTLLPLGKYTKVEIRELAEEFKLKTANKPDSMEICFVADNNYERFLRERVPEKIAEVPEGDLVYHGKVVGKHHGIPFYTVGQRKGLGIALGTPVYVKNIDVKNNIIELADKDELLEFNVFANQINYVSKSILEEGMQVIAKIRYSDKGSEAEIVKSTENEIQLKFILPKSAITPGQSLVIYDNSGYVLAGGIIDRINS